MCINHRLSFELFTISKEPFHDDIAPKQAMNYSCLQLSEMDFEMCAIICFNFAVKFKKYLL